MASVRSVSSNAASSGTSLSVSAPSGTTAGDVVIVIIHCNHQNTTSDNNGSTPFTKDLDDYKPNPAYGHTYAVYSRRILSGDPTTFNFTISASGRWGIIALSIMNPHPSIIYDASIVTAGSELEQNNMNAPSITTNTANAIHIASAGIDDGVSSVTGFPSGYSNNTSVLHQPFGVATKVISSPGATGAQNFTFSTSSARIGVSLAIRAQTIQNQNLAILGIGS